MSKAWLDLATIPVGFHYDSGTIPLQCLRKITLKSPFNLREICLLHGIEHELGIAFFPLRFRLDSATIPLRFKNDSGTISERFRYDVCVKSASNILKICVKSACCMESNMN